MPKYILMALNGPTEAEGHEDRERSANIWAMLVAGDN
jgi:hypothetical protein